MSYQLLRRELAIELKRVEFLTELQFDGISIKLFIMIVERLNATYGFRKINNRHNTSLVGSRFFFLLFIHFFFLFLLLFFSFFASNKFYTSITFND